MNTRPPIPTAQAAEQLGIHWRTLGDWRRNGNGPRAVRLGGRWMYRPDDLTAWLDAQPEQAG